MQRVFTANHLGRLSWLLAAGLAVAGASCAPTAETDRLAPKLVEQSEALADSFQAQLKNELSTALSAVGPDGAVGVCQSAAPAIAQSLSDQRGVDVQRIARKNRNPANEVPADLERLYAQLEASPLDNGAPKAVHAKLNDRFVYLRAIPMQEKPCSTCHGTNIDPALKATILKAYPSDNAVGFEPGELRGAFLIEHSTVN